MLFLLIEYKIFILCIIHFFQQSMKQEAVNLLETIEKELMEPFSGLIGMADTFINRYGKVFNIIKSVKDAYDILKEG